MEGSTRRSGEACARISHNEMTTSSKTKKRRDEKKKMHALDRTLSVLLSSSSLSSSRGRSTLKYTHILMAHESTALFAFVVHVYSPMFEKGSLLDVVVVVVFLARFT